MRNHGKTRPLTKEDFSQKSAIFLPEKAYFDNLVAKTEGERAEAIIQAMESIPIQTKASSTNPKLTELTKTTNGKKGPQRSPETTGGMLEGEYDMEGTRQKA